MQLSSVKWQSSGSVALTLSNCLVSDKSFAAGSNSLVLNGHCPNFGEPS